MKNKIIFFIIIFPILFLFSEQKSYAQFMNCSDAGGSCIDDNLFNINQHLLITNSNNADCSPGQVCAKNQPPCVSPATCVSTTQCDGDKITGYCDGSLNTICCSAEYIFNSAYTVTCIGSNNQIFGPYQVNSRGMLLNDNNAIPEIVKHFWPSVEQMTMAWKSMDETQKNNYLEYIENNYGVRCKIEEIINNHVYGALDETPPKSEPLKFTSEVGIPTFKGEQTVDGGLLGKFAKVFYSYLLGLSGIVCVIILILAGFQWVTAGGNQNKIGEAKERIKNVITGLVLLGSSYLIMYTINPDLVKIHHLSIEYFNGAGFEDYNVPDYGQNCGEYAVENNGAYVPDAISKNISSYSYNKNFFSFNFENKYSNRFFNTLFVKANASEKCSPDGCPIRKAKYKNCSPGGIIEGALALRWQVAGPCHCACFVTSALMYNSCTIPMTTSVETLVESLNASPDWTAYSGEAAKKYYPQRGDIVTCKGHTGIVLTTDQEYDVVWIIHSSPITPYSSLSWMENCYGKCCSKSAECDNSWHVSSLPGKGHKRLFLNAKCSNNQAVIISRDTLFFEPNYTIYKHKNNRYLTFKTTDEAEQYRSADNEQTFFDKYGNPNYKGGEKAYDIIYDKIYDSID